MNAPFYCHDLDPNDAQGANTGLGSLISDLTGGSYTSLTDWLGKAISGSGSPTQGTGDYTAPYTDVNTSAGGGLTDLVDTTPGSIF